MGAPAMPALPADRLRGVVPFELSWSGSAGETVHPACQQVKTLADNLHVVLTGQATPESRAEMESAFAKLAESVRGSSD